MGNRLVKAGVPVQQTAAIIAAGLLPLSFEFLWAPVVDGCLTRRNWYISGVAVTCAGFAALRIAPWRSSAVPLMTVVAFCACSGAAMARIASARPRRRDLRLQGASCIGIERPLPPQAAWRAWQQRLADYSRISAVIAS